MTKHPGGTITGLPPTMIEAKERLEPDLLNRPGVVGLAVGLAEVDGELTDTLAIKIYVEAGHPVRGELPESVEGYPVNVVEHPIVAEPETAPVPPGLIEATRRLQADLRDRPGVVGFGVGPAEVDGQPTSLAIKIYVEPGHAVRAE